MIDFKKIIGSLPVEPKETSTIPENGFFYRETKTSHEYYYNKKRLTGVTTALNSINKPNLIKWAVDLACDYITKLIKDGFNIITVHVEEARKQHTIKKDEAADIGTVVHDACEQYLKHGTIPTFKPGSIELDCFNNFKDWWGTDKKLIASEQRLYNLEYWYAGTCDLVYEQGGKVYIGDIKTSNAKKDHKTGKYELWDRTYHAQTAAYQYAYEHLTNEKVSGRIIIRIGKDGSFSTHESFAFEQDFAVFLAALTIHRYN